MNIQEAGSAFQELLGMKPAPSFNFQGNPPEYVNLFKYCVLDVFSIKYWICEVPIEGFYCVKVQDDRLGYLIVGPDSFMWCDKNCENSIHPDEVLIHLMKTYHGVDAKIGPERTLELFKDGKPVAFKPGGRDRPPARAPRAGGGPEER